MPRTPQKAILNTSNTPETFKKSRKRTSLDEFAAVNNLRPEIKAGFKAWLNGQYFHFDEEWNKLFEQYSDR